MARLVTVTLEPENGLSEDRYVNTFAFTGGVNATDAELDAMMDGVLDLYNTTAPGNGSALGANLSSDVSRAASHSIKVYDIDGALGGGPHGSPIRERLWTLTPPAAGTLDLPHEVAIAVRLEAIGRADAPVETVDGPDPDVLVDRPKQRHTGRVYFGPLNTNVLPARDSQQMGRLTTNFTELFARAFKHLADQTFPATLGVNMRLGVWSRKDARVTALESVQVDNAFDTQRRRGVAPSAGTRLTVV